MSSPSKRDDALKKALEEAHRSLDPPAPAFRAIWARAEAERREAATGHHGSSGPGSSWARRSAWVPFGGLAAALCLLVALMWTGGLRLPSRQPSTAALSPEETLRLAEDLSSWESPLDFLDQPPGSELFDSFPRIYSPPAEIDLDTEGEPSTLETVPGGRIPTAPRPTLPPATLVTRPV